MAFRFQWLSSLWHSEHLLLIVSFADCCLSTDYKYCRVLLTTRDIFFQFCFSQLTPCFAGNLIVVGRRGGKSQEKMASWLRLGMTSMAPPCTEAEANWHERRRLLEGFNVQIVLFCHKGNPIRHFKPSHWRDVWSRIHLKYITGTEVEEGRAGAKALLQDSSSVLTLSCFSTTN